MESTVKLNFVGFGFPYKLKLSSHFQLCIQYLRSEKCMVWKVCVL